MAVVELAEIHAPVLALYSVTLIDVPAGALAVHEIVTGVLLVAPHGRLKSPSAIVAVAW